MHLTSLYSLLLLAVAPSVALAQTRAPSHAGAATTPAAAYQSAFSGYRPYTEPVVMSWRLANDQVRDMGGMQGHDMATMKSPTDDPHAGHAMSKMTPAKPSASDPTAAAHEAHGAKKARHEDPHAGHDMSRMPPARPDAAAGHAAHGTPAVNESKNKKEQQ